MYQTKIKFLKFVRIYKDLRQIYDKNRINKSIRGYQYFNLENSRFESKQPQVVQTKQIDPL